MRLLLLLSLVVGMPRGMRTHNHNMIGVYPNTKFLYFETMKFHWIRFLLFGHLYKISRLQCLSVRNSSI